MIGRLAKRLSSSGAVKKQDMAATHPEPEGEGPQASAHAQVSPVAEGHQAAKLEDGASADGVHAGVQRAPSAASKASTKEKDSGGSASASVVMASSAAATVGHTASSYFPHDTERVPQPEGKTVSPAPTPAEPQEEPQSGSPSTVKPSAPPSTKRPSPPLSRQKPASSNVFSRLLSPEVPRTGRATSSQPNAAAEGSLQTFTSRTERQAYEAALDLRTLIVGPSALAGSIGATSPLTKAQVKKLRDSMMKPEQGNKIMAHLRTLPSHPDHPALMAASGKGAANLPPLPAPPIHAACLSVTDEQAEKQHFAKLYVVRPLGPVDLMHPPSAATAGPSAHLDPAAAPAEAQPPTEKHTPSPAKAKIASPSLPSLSPEALKAALGSLNLISLVTAPDLGLGESADKPGILAGAIPSADEIETGVDEVSKSLMALGFAGSGMVWPSHTGVYPPEDRISAYTYWWGYEIVLPHPSVVYLGNCESISNTVLNILTALSIFASGVREILPFVRYIAQFADMQFADIKAQDKGKGVVCAATWLLPVALIPRTWDFPPRPANLPKTGPVMTPVLPQGPQPAAAAPAIVSLTAPIAATSASVPDANPAPQQPETDVAPDLLSAVTAYIVPTAEAASSTAAAPPATAPAPVYVRAKAPQVAAVA